LSKQRRRVEASNPADGEHGPLIPDDLLKGILDAPRLPFRSRDVLADAVHEAAQLYLIARDAEQASLSPSRDAQRAKTAASGLDGAVRALSLLTDELLAWAGYQAEEEEPRDEGACSGFEEADRARDDVERARTSMVWLRDKLRAWARQTQESPGGKGGRPSRRGSRLVAVEILMPAFEKAFGQPMGASRGGPAARLLEAFFAAFRRSPGEDAILALIRSAKENSV